ncbi:MAG: cyclic pyranopterin monophosphate synthase MoaC [Pseudomonadota bacterium]|nr:cyclic pyranopterin monophosphate synthase MoaC [Pseudomonadota bacterium]
MKKITHLNEEEEAHMVDISEKRSTSRKSAASGFIKLRKETIKTIRSKKLPKGGVLSIARIAGIMAAKKTSEIIPLCHPIALSSVTIDFNITDKGIEVITNVSNQGKTGVEMEALTATSVCCLTIYDMTKSIDRSAEISSIKLMSKSGGKSGNWKRR